MKLGLKISMALIALGTVAFFAACNNSSAATETKEDALHKHAEAGHHHGEEHIYACPMHPEVTGKEGDTCPKCGMKLEHNDNAGAANGDTYFMQFVTNPAAINPNQDVTLSLTPKKKGKENEPIALDVEHEKKIHLIVVSEDLSYFNHIHPEIGADGSYTVNAKFPAGGNYILFADFKPSGGNHTVDKLSVKVTGNAPAPKKYTADKLTVNVDGYTVSLTPEGGKFITNMPMHIAGAVTQNGKPVDPNTMENYLGTKAHMVVVSLEDKNYLHVHPGVENGKFDLHTTFDKPGIYHAWIQFQTNNQVHTADFVINVTEGKPGDVKAGDMKDMNH